MLDSAASRFDMGRVIGNTFEVLGRNFVPFLLVALGLSGIPAFLLQFLSISTPKMSLTGPMLTGLVALIKGVLSLVLQGTLVSGAISSLNGNRIDLNAMLSRGASAALPLFGLAILEGLGIGLGFLLLIVPGLILATLWSVAAPALVVERTGVFDAFSRSSDLTRGRRWPVFGLLVVYAILTWIVSAISGAILFAVGGGLAAITAGSLPLFSTALFSGIVATVFGALSASGVASLYYELRFTKEGVAPQAVLDTFS